MAFKLPSRVLETFTTTGTGTITLAGAVSGYRTFASGLSNGDTCFYFMTGGADYEIGLATYSGGTLARTTVLKSSNANAAVNWASGTKIVGIAPLGPSDLDVTNLGRLQGALGISTAIQALLDDATVGAGRATLGAFGNCVVQVFTGSGTYTPTSGMLFCIIEAIGGGGGGGGVDADVGGAFCGGGGGAGSRSVKRATAADIGASKAVTIGAGGAGGTAGANAGSAGGDTSVGSLCIGKGGSGGGATSAGAFGAGGAGGVAGTGDANGTGMPGTCGFVSSILTAYTFPGNGGSGPYGGGGRPSIAATGGAGTGYGSGGGGGSDLNQNANRAGGAGAAGIVIITEFLP